jgi:hypothetical protein
VNIFSAFENERLILISVLSRFKEKLLPLTAILSVKRPIFIPQIPIFFFEIWIFFVDSTTNFGYESAPYT